MPAHLHWISAGVEQVCGRGFTYKLREAVSWCSGKRQDKQGWNTPRIKLKRRKIEDVIWLSLEGDMGHILSAWLQYHDMNLYISAEVMMSLFCDRQEVVLVLSLQDEQRYESETDPEPLMQPLLVCVTTQLCGVMALLLISTMMLPEGTFSKVKAHSSTLR